MSLELTIRDEVFSRLIKTGWAENQQRSADDSLILKDRLRQRLVALGEEKYLDQVYEQLTDSKHLKAFRTEDISCDADNIQHRQRFLQANKTNLRSLVGAEPFSIDGNRNRLINIIDLNNYSNNYFEIGKEVYFARGQYRADLVCWINGIPLIIAEFKGVKGHISEAVSQLSEYCRNAPKPFLSSIYSLAVRPGGPSDDFLGKVVYGCAIDPSVAGWQSWRSRSLDLTLDSADERALLAGVTKSDSTLTLVVDLLDVERVTSWCSFQIFHAFDSRSGKPVKRRDSALPGQKFIPRPQQVRAAELISRRHHSTPDNQVRKGLIQHHQGAGKSMLLIMAAQLVIDRSRQDQRKVRVLIVVDRKELVAQIKGDINRCQLNSEFEVADQNSTSAVKEYFSKNDRSTMAVVSTIHAFDQASDKIRRSRFAEDSNVLLLCDEAHRSQEGDMAIRLADSLPRATRIGLTGTPILQEKHDTFSNFGDPNDPGNLLDYYGMKESQRDKFTVPIVIREIKLSINLRDDQFSNYDVLNDIWKSEPEAAVAKRLEDRLKDSRLNLSRDEILQEIAERTFEDFRGYNNRNQLKGILVVSSRIACVRVHEILLGLGMKSDELATVFTPIAKKKKEETGEGGGGEVSEEDREEIELIQQLHSQQLHSSGLDDQEVDRLNKYSTGEKREREIKEDFNNPEHNLKLLIVTDKLLTGFDAPILGVMYLAKAMNAPHALFQAVTRVNRSYTTKSPGETTADYIDESGNKISGMVVMFLPLQARLGEAIKEIDDFWDIDFEREQIDNNILSSLRNELVVLEEVIVSLEDGNMTDLAFGMAGRKLTRSQSLLDTLSLDTRRDNNALSVEIANAENRLAKIALDFKNVNQQISHKDLQSILDRCYEYLDVNSQEFSRNIRIDASLADSMEELLAYLYQLMHQEDVDLDAVLDAVSSLTLGALAETLQRRISGADEGLPDLNDNKPISNETLSVTIDEFESQSLDGLKKLSETGTTSAVVAPPSFAEVTDTDNDADDGIVLDEDKSPEVEENYEFIESVIEGDNNYFSGDKPLGNVYDLSLMNSVGERMGELLSEPPHNPYSLATSVAKLLAAHDWEIDLEELLEQLGEDYNADRSYTEFQLSNQIDLDGRQKWAWVAVIVGDIDSSDLINQSAESVSVDELINLDKGTVTFLLNRHGAEVIVGQGSSCASAWASPWANPNQREEQWTEAGLPALGPELILEDYWLQEEVNEAALWLVNMLLNHHPEFSRIAATAIFSGDKGWAHYQDDFIVLFGKEGIDKQRSLLEMMRIGEMIGFWSQLAENHKHGKVDYNTLKSHLDRIRVVDGILVEMASTI